MQRLVCSNAVLISKVKTSCTAVIDLLQMSDVKASQQILDE